MADDNIIELFPEIETSEKLATLLSLYESLRRANSLLCRMKSAFEGLRTQGKPCGVFYSPHRD